MQSRPANTIGAWDTVAVEGDYVYGNLVSAAVTSTGAGVIYRLNTRTGLAQRIHEFQSSPSNGFGPRGLTVNDGVVYGITALSGAYGKGIVYRVNASGGNFSILHNFNNAVFGEDRAQGGAIVHKNRVYGVTTAGGVWSVSINGGDWSLIENLAGSGYSFRQEPVITDKGIYVTSVSGGEFDAGALLFFDSKYNPCDIRNSHTTETGIVEIGSANEDIINGGPLDDFLAGCGSDDSLFGDTGNDTLVGGPGNDEIDGGAGIDTIDFSSSSSGVVVNLLASTIIYDGENTIDAYSAYDGDGGVDYLNNVENIVGSRFDDYLRGSNLFPSIIKGQHGDDRINGQALDDELYGGIGTDDIHGNGGNDTIYGGIGDDILRGGSGDDQIFSGSDDDLVFGGTGMDTIYGEAGIDRLRGEDDDDEIYGGPDNDFLYGQNGNDTLIGGTGNDRLFGNDGTDTLVGGEGDDRLWGHDGEDTMTGGTGSDIFYFSPNETGIDIITDFSESDVIDLSNYEINYDANVDTLSNFVQFIEVESDSILTISPNGSLESSTPILKILGQTGLNADALLSNNNLVL